MDENLVQPPKVNTESEDGTQKPEDKPPVVSVDIGEIDPKGQTCTAKPDQNKRKRKPLSRSDIWTIALAIIGIIVAGGTGGAIVYQDIIASRTLNEMRTQFAVSHRPWVSLTRSPDVASPLTIDAKRDKQIRVILTLRNTGTEPAIGVVTNMHLILGQQKQWMTLINKECGDDLADVVKTRQGGDLLVPGLERSIPSTTIELEAKGSQATVNTSQIFLVGCIGYYGPEEFDGVKPPPHKTSFVEQLVPGKKGRVGTFETVGWGNAQ